MTSVKVKTYFNLGNIRSQSKDYTKEMSFAIVKRKVDRFKSIP